MEPNACAHCGAPLRPAAGYCRACDTPVAGAQSGRLSVGEAVPVELRHRWLVVTGALAVVVLVGALTYGALHMVGSRHAATAAAATDAAHRALTLLVRAESGQAGACGTSLAHLAGRHPVVREECLAIVGSDPGVRLEDVHFGDPSLHGQAGTVRVTATVADDRGSRAYTHTLHLVEESGRWLVSWDGQRPV